MDKKDQRTSKLQAVIITLCTVIVGLSSYIYYISTKDNNTAQRCEYNGWAYADGESFAAEDGCNTCVCSNGEVVCTEMACVENSTTCEPGDICDN